MKGSSRASLKATYRPDRRVVSRVISLSPLGGRCLGRDRTLRAACFGNDLLIRNWRRFPAHCSKYREYCSLSCSGWNSAGLRGAIGVTADSVEGVDIQVPIYTFSESHIILNELVTQAYKLSLFQLTGKVNSAGFKGFARGEVLFLGASGSKRGFDDWEITFRFAASPNATNLTIGGISGISKEGWQYLWIRYEDEEDTSAKTLIKRPSAIYIEQVYNYGDFALMGIGV